MARINRECRSLSFQRPIHILFPDELSRKPLYRSKDLVRENIREAQIMRKKEPVIRQVPPFSVQATQRNTRAMSLPSRHRSRSAVPRDTQTDDWSQFRLSFESGEFPIRLEHGASGERPKRLRWVKTPDQMNAESIRRLLPRFALGLPLIDQPFRFVAEHGVNDLLDAIPSTHSEIVISVLPQLVRAIRAGLYSFDMDKKKEILKILSKITKLGECGPALMPFYRQLLPPLRQVTFSGVKTDISYARGRQLEEIIEHTLHDLERTGGPNAFINIKYVIPTYDSCKLF